MSLRLKVLISAYACEPGKGSEPEVGWQWALQMARFHDLTVLTRANNRPLIEPELERLKGKQPLPNFVYHDRGPALLEFKRRFKAHKIYYLLWQRSAREVIQRLHEVHRYELMHHVTFAAFRYPIAVWGHGAPCIWGPVGGIESIPAPLLPWRHPVSLAHEVLRNLHNVLQATPFHVLPRRARATTLILATTREMQRAFARLGFQAELVPTIGLKTAELPWRPHPRSEGPLKLLFVGNIITLKGLDLALEALKQSGANATFTLVGSGNYQEAAQALAKRLGLQDRITFAGRLPREQVLKLYPEFDLFVFPSLHDTGGYAVIEAMLNELPVLCLDCGGPAVAVSESCGVKVPLGPRPKVIAGLAAAFRQYDQDRTTLARHGQSARAVVLRGYDWDRKGEQMNECYQAACAKARLAAKPS
jgi:glycosyltransferase involved in cell wall biosynthesis